MNMTLTVTGRSLYRGHLVEIGFYDNDEKACLISREDTGEITHRMFFRFSVGADTILNAAEKWIETTHAATV